MMSQTGRDSVMTLADLLIGKWLPDDVSAIEVGGICLDHRLINPGEVFIAVPGVQHDGRNYMEAAIGKGAAAVLRQAESAEETIEWLRGVPVIPQVDLVKKVSAIAADFYANPSDRATVIGVTGTNGKSTCAYLLAQLFDRLGRKSGVIGTLGYGQVTQLSGADSLTDTGLTTTDAIATQKILAELVNGGAQTIAMEVSSHSLVQHRVSAVEYEVAVFTNLSRDHLDYHGDMANYGAAKESLFKFDSLKHRVINWDDEFGRLISGKLNGGATNWTYSIDDPAAHIYTKAIKQTPTGMVVELESCWGKGTLKTQLLGQFNLSNILAVIVCACALGYELQQVLSECEHLRPVPGRMEKIEDSNEITVVVDYAHTPDALANALRAMRQHTAGQLICLFGCGGDRDKGKRPLMASVAESLADQVVVTSDNPRTEQPEAIIADIHAGFSDLNNVIEIEDRAAAIRYCIKQAGAGDSVLIAGKGHEEYQQIGGDRLPFSDIKQARLALRKK